jgi:hypothetical protein
MMPRAEADLCLMKPFELIDTILFPEKTPSGKTRRLRS